MTPSQPDLKALFLEALEHPEGPDRETFLEQACRGDAGLRAALEGLLEAHDRAGRFLGSAAGEGATVAEGDTTAAEAGHSAPTDPPATAAAASIDATEAPGPNGSPVPRSIAEGPGSRIGPYTLVDKLGEGGMGAVFLAEQDRPVKRRVALKVIKPGMDTEQVVMRFEAERQALAMMDHPHIARVFDAGSTDSGRPFFVMELVDGVPINEYCDDERLGPRKRLELFAMVCQAIQHAHQKGIIHRDIKASNVLVTVRDGQPVPKVIDFGVAKAIDQRLTERTLFTQLGALVGTPEYMSPEQADFSGGGIDTRSDIYSLGVLLYELLTGTTPLGRVRLREAAFAEVLRRIREEEPPRPSTRLSGSGEALASIAACRDVEPARLTKLVRGELDWIAMKALEKDRARRYATAMDLARDIERHLAGDPVEAGPPSLSYRAGKYARKHRAAFGVAAGFLLLLLGASVVSTWLMLRARAAERLAERRLDEVQRAHAETTAALAETERARQGARTEADKATAVNAFLVKDLLTQAEPASNAVEDHVTLLDVLDRAADTVGRRFGDRPELEESLRRTIAGTYHGLGAWEKAVPQWQAVVASARRRHGPESPAALTAQAELAHLLRHYGQRDAAVFDLARAASDGLERSLGREHPDALTARNHLAVSLRDAGRFAEAIPLQQDVLATRERTLGADHPDTLQSRLDLAEAYRKAGRPAEALALDEGTVKLRSSRLGPDHPDTLASRGCLALDYLVAGRNAEALALMDPTLKAMESKLGLSHTWTLSLLAPLSEAYCRGGRPDEAIALVRRALGQMESRLGPDHPLTHAMRLQFGRIHVFAGRPDEAIPILKALLERYEKTIGPDRHDTLQACTNLVWAYGVAGRAAEAARLLEARIGQMEAVLGPDSAVTLNARENLAWAYDATGRYEEALRLLQPELERREARFGAGHPYTFNIVRHLADTLASLGRRAEAEPLFRRALEGYRNQEGPDGFLTLNVTGSLACLLCRSGRVGEGEPLLRELIARRWPRLPSDDPSLAEALESLAPSLVLGKKRDEAEAVLWQCLIIRRRLRPDEWTTFDALSQLGGCLLAEEEFTGAEPLLLAGYEGMRAREARIPPLGRPRLSEAAGRIVALYQAWGKPEKAAAWRARLGPDELPADVFAP